MKPHLACLGSMSSDGSAQSPSAMRETRPHLHRTQLPPPPAHPQGAGAPEGPTGRSQVYRHPQASYAMHTPSLSRGRSARGGREGLRPPVGARLRGGHPPRLLTAARPPTLSQPSPERMIFLVHRAVRTLGLETGGRSWSWSYGIRGMRSDGREGGRRPPTRRSEHPARCLLYTRQRVCPSCMHGVPCTAQSLHRVHKTTCKPQYVKHAVHRTPQRIADSGVRACAIGAVYRSTACTRTHV